MQGKIVQNKTINFIGVLFKSLGGVVGATKQNSKT